MYPYVPILDRLLVRYIRGPDHPAKLRIVNWIVGLLRLDTVFAETAVGLMRLNIKDLIQRQILWDGTYYEARTMHLLEKLLRTGDCFVDVGANVGVYSLAATRCVGKSGRVIAIEPNPEICAELLCNRRLNNHESTMLVVAAAASDKNGLIRFAVPKSDQLNLGLSRELRDGKEEVDWFLVSSDKVKEILDKLSIPSVNVIKIDVEGSELRVLRGLLDDSEIPPPQHILFEFKEFAYNDTSGELMNYLEKKGYEIFNVEEARYRLGDDIPEDNLWARFKTASRG